MTLIEKLEDYADSLSDDCSTIENFDMSCCDARELEVLRNVFTFLDNLIKENR